MEKKMKDSPQDIAKRRVFSGKPVCLLFLSFFCFLSSSSSYDTRLFPLMTIDSKDNTVVFPHSCKTKQCLLSKGVAAGQRKGEKEAKD